MRTRDLVVALGLAVASLGAAARPDAEVDRLVAKIEAEQKNPKQKDFNDLARIGTADAFGGSVRVLMSVRGRDFNLVAHRAFRHYKGKGELEQRAIEFLEESAFAGTIHVQRGASAGLALMGPNAEAAQRRVLDDSKDAVCRSYALGPLLDAFAEDGSAASLELVLDNTALTRTGSRKKLLANWKRYTSGECAALFLDRIEERKYPSALKQIALEVLVSRKDDGVGAAIEAALAQKDPPLQYLALQFVAESGSEEFASILKKLSKSPDQDVRRRALVQIARHEGGDPAFVTELLKWSRHKDVSKRQAALDGLFEVRDERSLERLYELLADGDPRVRAAALERASSLRTPRTISALIECIGREPGALRESVVRSLRLLTGLDNGRKPERWRTWWAKEKDGFAIPTYEEALKAERTRRASADAGRSKTQFYGLDVVSDRVCFILDTSGSMRQETKAGDPRIKKAREELEKALTAYPDGELVNAIFFSGGVRPWQEELVVMNKRRRAEVLEFLSEQRANGATAIYDALEVAFADPRIDTIYLMTDGTPSGGTIDDPDEIARQVARWNSTRYIKIHCIAVGSKQPLLKRLAAETGGAYRRVD